MNRNRPSLPFRFVTCLLVFLIAYPPLFLAERPASAAPGEALPLAFSGYYKNLFVASKTIEGEKSYIADTQRFRLETGFKFSENWSAKVVADQDTFLHDNLSGTRELELVRGNNQKSLAWWDADHTFSDDEDVYAKLGLYRAFLKYDNGPFQATIGKQLVDWGRTRFFSPIDLFNPVSPVSIERDERIGVDAANVEWALDDVTSLNAVFAPRRRSDDASVGLKIFRRVGDYDLFLIGGEFRNDTVVGIGFDGYIKEAGFRGEFTQTHSASGRNFFRGAIGAEYAFANSLTLLGEYFYNGGAEDNDPAAALGSYAFFNRTLTTQKHFFGFNAQYELTPLLKLSGYAIYDISGGSVTFGPELRYNIKENLDLSVGVQAYWGDIDSEFGSYQHIYYAQLQFFFG